MYIAELPTQLAVMLLYFVFIYSLKPLLWLTFFVLDIYFWMSSSPGVEEMIDCWFFLISQPNSWQTLKLCDVYFLGSLMLHW